MGACEAAEESPKAVLPSWLLHPLTHSFPESQASQTPLRAVSDSTSGQSQRPGGTAGLLIMGGENRAGDRSLSWVYLLQLVAEPVDPIDHLAPELSCRTGDFHIVQLEQLLREQLHYHLELLCVH